MTLFKSAFSHLSHKSTSTPVVATNMSLDSWCHQMRTESTRFISKVEICTAIATEIAAGDNVWAIPIDKSHLHTFLRVSLGPTPSGFAGKKDDVLLIERVLSTGGSYHSVTPISEELSMGGTLFHPEVHDRICVISEGPSTAVAHRLEVERTLKFGNSSPEPCLTVFEFAQILALLSQITRLICDGGDCKFQSRSFAFTCMAALTPSLPPSTLVRKSGERVGMNTKHGADLDDLVFEKTAETFLKQQVPWLVKDATSMQAVKLILALKDDLRERGR